MKSEQYSGMGLVSWFMIELRQDAAVFLHWEIVNHPCLFEEWSYFARIAFHPHCAMFQFWLDHTKDGQDWSCFWLVLSCSVSVGGPIFLFSFLCTRLFCLLTVFRDKETLKAFICRDSLSFVCLSVRQKQAHTMLSCYSWTLVGSGRIVRRRVKRQDTTTSHCTGICLFNSLVQFWCSEGFCVNFFGAVIPNLMSLCPRAGNGRRRG